MEATIGQALKRRRSNLGIDQMAAAARIGMSRTSYSSYERDLQRPSVDVLPALARFLEIPMEGVLALYGATCVEAMRAALNEYLSGGGDRSVAAPSPDETSAKANLPEMEGGARREETIESVSIFANELSNGDAPLARETIAISSTGEAGGNLVEPLIKPKKKKKKKKGNKK